MDDGAYEYAQDIAEAWANAAVKEPEKRDELFEGCLKAVCKAVGTANMTELLTEGVKDQFYTITGGYPVGP